MKAIVYENGTARFVTDYPKPVPAAGESLVRIQLAAVCNTDREILRGYRRSFSGVMGHEFVGIIEQSDNPDMIGKHVVGELNINCGECLYCKTLRPHHCINRSVPGLDSRDGCFAQYMAYPTRLLHVVPDGLSDKAAVFCEPLAAALEITENNHVPPSQAAAVLGDGRLAYMTAQVIAANGTPVTVFGRHSEKLALFEDFAETSVNPEGSFEIVVDATGSPEALSTAIALTRSGGRLILKSTYSGTAEVDMSEIVVREITICGSRCGPFPPALNMLSRGLVQLPEIALYRPEDFMQAFASPAFKSGFDFRQAGSEE